MAKRRREALRMGATEKKGERNSTNPFVSGWSPEMTVTNKRLDLAKHPELVAAGLQPDAKVSVPRTRDSAKFMKVFEEAWDDFFSLSSTGSKLLGLIFYQARISNGLIHLPIIEGMEAIGFKQRKSFYDGINELILLEFIVRAEKNGYYYLNQKKVWNGSRVNIKNTPPKPKA